MCKLFECRGEASADNRLIPMRDLQTFVVNNIKLDTSMKSAVLTIGVQGRSPCKFLPLPWGRGSGVGDTKTERIKYLFRADRLKSLN